MNTATALRSADLGWFVKVPGTPGWFTRDTDELIRTQVAAVIAARTGEPVRPDDITIDYDEDD